MSLNTKQLGAGPDLVLVHGWALSLEIWEPVTEHLARDFCLTLVDLPGHGGSSLEGEFSLDAVVRKLAAVIPQGAMVLGWSLGGMFGLALAAQYPRQIHKLVLLAGNPCFVATPDRPYGMAPAVLEQFGRDLETDFQDTIGKFLAASTLYAQDGPALLRRLLQQMNTALQPHPEALQGGLQILRDTNLWPRLQDVSCPTLVMLGERDTLVPVAVGKELLRALPDSRLEIIPGAGHAPFLSHTKLFVQILKDFAGE